MTDDLPDMDEIAAAMLARYGPGWIDQMPGYNGLARSRGIPVAAVLHAASLDDLGSIVRLPLHDE